MDLFSDRYEVARANAGYPHRQLEEDRVETLTGTLIERVGALVDVKGPLLTTTPTSIAIQGLAARIDGSSTPCGRSRSRFTSSRRTAVRRIVASRDERADAAATPVR